MGGLVPGPGPWSGSGAGTRAPISQVEVRTCVTPLSKNTEERISPHWPSHRPLCSALSGDQGGVSTALTVLCSHHGYTATYAHTHAPTAPPVRARATSLYISVSFHRVGGGQWGVLLGYHKQQVPPRPLSPGCSNIIYYSLDENAGFVPTQATSSCRIKNLKQC